MAGGGGASGGASGGSPGGKASFGTDTAVDVMDSDSARPTSSGGAMTTQTAPPKSFYERFLEQKQRDGVQ